MSSKDFVENLDWQSAIAAATLELTNQTTPPPNPAELYLYRGIAHCFITDKEGKHKEAIEDLNTAIVMGVAEKNKAYYYRAYAFYLDGDYEQAIEDCWHIKKSSRGDELLGKIYLTMSNYHEAVKKFRHAMRWYNQKTEIPPPGLLDDYREACKRMNNE